MTDKQRPPQETIFALSSGSVPAGVAIIRLSGPRALPTVEVLSGALPQPRLMALRRICDPENGDHIDTGMIAVFPAPNSFTGEDCAELHLHGSRAVVAKLFDILARQADHRLAEAGEFTRRAFMNGKMDLTGAEALADLINAETEAQRRLALDNAAGRQHALYDGWRRTIIKARAFIEAHLDFADEDDVPDTLPPMLAAELTGLSRETEAHLKGFSIGEIIRDGFRVVIAGAPNAGKSSLLNALARRDVAIVSPVAGTTRDLIEVHLDLNGNKVIVTDTAGLRISGDAVEAIGVERAHAAMQKADLIIELKSLAPDDERTEYILQNQAELILVHSKADLAGPTDLPSGAPVISVKNGDGLEQLIDLIGDAASKATDSSSIALPTRQRHKTLIEECRIHLDRTLELMDDDIVLAAEELRLASECLGKLTGRIDVEHILDVVFGQFCIGK